MSLKVAVLSQHELIRRGVESTLEEFSGRVEIVRDDPTDRADVVLWSSFGAVRIPDIQLLRAEYSSARLAVLCWNFEPGMVEACLGAGAVGYLSTALTGEELVAALERIGAGETVVSPSPRGAEETDPDVLPSWPGKAEAGLSEREGDIVALIANGCSNDDIAGQLFLSINTVKSYIRSAYRKMGVESRSQAVLWGVDHGLRGHRPTDPVTDAP